MMNRAIFDKNADACENAKHPNCVCACGGALHGQPHSPGWRREMWAAIDAEQRAAAAQTPAAVAARAELARVEQAGLEL